MSVCQNLTDVSFNACYQLIISHLQHFLMDRRTASPRRVNKKTWIQYLTGGQISFRKHADEIKWPQSIWISLYTCKCEEENFTRFCFLDLEIFKTAAPEQVTSVSSNNIYGLILTKPLMLESETTRRLCTASSGHQVPRNQIQTELKRFIVKVKFRLKQQQKWEH